MKPGKLIPLIFGVLLLVSACMRDKLDFKMVDDLRFNPDIEAPLVKARLSLNDLVEKDSSNTFVVNPDNSLRIRYYQEDLVSFQPFDFVDIPSQDPVSVPAIVGQPPYDFEMGLGTIGGVELTEAEFHQGYFVVEVKSSVPLAADVEVEVTLLNALKNGQQVRPSIVLIAGSTTSKDSIDLQQAVFDLSNGGQSVNYFAIRTDVKNPPVTLTGTPLEVGLQFTLLDLERAEGFFGNREINIPSGSFDFDVSGIKELVDGFYVSNPTIRLLTASNVGIELEVAPDLDGQNKEGAVTSLDVDPQTISAAANSSSYDTSAIVFNPNNSNVVDFLAALPNRVLYSGKAALNPGGATNTNFVTRESEVSVGVEVDIPLELSIQNMRLEQTLSDIKLFNDDSSGIDALTLIFYTSNGFPFGLDLTVAFLDSTTQDSIQGFDLGLLRAAEIGNNGEIISRGEFAPQEVTFDGDMLEKLKRSDKIRFRATLNTPNAGQEVQKFYTHFDLEIKVAAKAKLNVKL